MLSVDNMPVGIQIITQREQDAMANSLAGWIYENVEKIDGD
jgi:hypothetical protein